ncbi:MAG: 4Fe-4S dicluster domain-containing protein [Thermoplasmata archaeon]|nr:4Fe-4S dicluster domain-containing protein [Thermoplasmata archaeon]
MKKSLSKQDFLRFLDNLISDDTLDVFGVKAKGKRFVFAPLESSSELRLDYDVTILPPKKFFLPQYETLLKFDVSRNSVSHKLDGKTRVVVGVHPYDIVALQQMDKVYFNSYVDRFYKQRRENTIIIGSDILNVSDRSFAASMGTHVVSSGYDLLVTDLGDTVVVDVGSEKGRVLLEKHTSELRDVSEKEVKRVEELRAALPGKYKRSLKVEKERWREVLGNSYDHPLWKELSEKCLQCSSCTMVCPTCYCFDVKDEVSLNTVDGVRVRTWDGCLLPDFSKVASGEVFRKEKSERFRHRFYRKGLYLPERYGFVACVGCGRCAIACLPDIADPLDVINSLVERKSEAEGVLRFSIPESKAAAEETDYLPRNAVIKRMEKLTEMETLFELEMEDGEPLVYEPGQFVEVSVFGVGEAPISISSPPQKSSSFELVVRRAGNVTSRLHSMRVGDRVGIRGPFGRGFDVKALEGRNLIFVAGGIGMVPMRSLICYVLDDKKREDYGMVTVLYGSKTPQDVLFMDEIKEWEKKSDVTVKLTVDTCPEGVCWDGCVGLVTSLFPQVRWKDVENTVAVVVGPPVMYKFVIKCLHTMGVRDENIYVSLERRMKCGVGKCGHCQINGVYVCKEGPVFNYSEIKDLPEAFS